MTRDTVWLASGGKIDVYRRSLQRAYIENLNLKLNPPAAAAGAGGRAGGGGGGGGGRPQAPTLDPKLSDLNAVVRAELKALDAELKKFVKGKLAPHKYPREITFVSELPKTATGKIQRFKLRALHQTD